MGALRGCALAALALAAAACSGGDGEPAAWGPSPAADTAVSRPLFDPADLGAVVDNLYLPLRPGSRWVYRTTGSQGDARITVRVLPRERVVAGVPVTVVRDTVRSDAGTRDTWYWFAQDSDGNVWCLGRRAGPGFSGQDPRPSWVVGRDGAQAGIAMLGDPVPGAAYREEVVPGAVEERATVVATDADVTVAAGTFIGTVKVARSTPAQPRRVVHEYYAAGVGMIYREVASGGDQRTWLVALRIPPVARV